MADIYSFTPLPPETPTLWHKYANAVLTGFFALLLAGGVYALLLTYPRWSKFLIKKFRLVPFFTWARIAGIIMLILSCASEDTPGLYCLTRWIACPVLGVLAWRACKRGQLPWAWSFGIGAGVFNPILLTHMGDLWPLLDFAAAGLILASFAPLKTNREKHCEGNISVPLPEDIRNRNKQEKEKK